MATSEPVDSAELDKLQAPGEVDSLQFNDSEEANTTQVLFENSFNDIEKKIISSILPEDLQSVEY